MELSPIYGHHLALLVYFLPQATGQDAFSMGAGKLHPGNMGNALTHREVSTADLIYNKARRSRGGNKKHGTMKDANGNASEYQNMRKGVSERAVAAAVVRWWDCDV